VGYRKVNQLLEQLPRGNYYGSGNNTLILLAPPHSISVTPSREALSMQEHTINTVNKLIQNFIDYMNQKDEQLESILLKESITKATPMDLLCLGTKLNKHSFALDAWQASKMLITEYKLYRRAVRSHQNMSGVNRKDMLLRIKAADEQKLLAKGKAHSLYREIQRADLSDLHGQTTWVARHVINPLLRKMKLNTELNTSRLFFTGYSGCRSVNPEVAKNTTRELTEDKPVYLCDWNIAAKHARPYVVIHYVRKEVDYRIEKHGVLKGTHKQEVLFYHVPRVAGKVQAVIDFFTAEGYEVIDLTKPLAGEAPDVVAPVVRATGGTRQQGLIALSAAARHGAFDGDTLYSEDAKRISTAECMFICTNTDGQRRSNQLGSFGEVSNIIMNLYGDVAGIAKTQDQFDRYMERGIKNGTTYVAEDVISYITESDIILQHYTAKRTMAKHNFRARIYEYLIKSKVACDMFNLPFITEPEDKSYMQLWEYMKRNLRSVSASTENDIDNLPDHQATLDICKKIEKSKYYVFLDTNLYITQTEFDERIVDFVNFINL